jgi:hypothetical protein
MGSMDGKGPVLVDELGLSITDEGAGVREVQSH